MIKNRKYYTNLVKFGFAKWEKMSEEEKKEYYEKKKEGIELSNVMSYGQDILYKTSDEDITNNDFVRMGIMKNLMVFSPGCKTGKDLVRIVWFLFKVSL